MNPSPSRPFSSYLAVVLFLAVSLGAGLGVTFVPEAVANLPEVLRIVFSSGIATGGVCAIGLNLVLPRR